MASTETLGIINTAKYNDIRRPNDHRTERQVPGCRGPAKFIYVRVRLHIRDASSTSIGDPNVYERCTTLGALGSIKSDYLHVYHYRRPEDVGVIKYLSE